MGVFVEMYDPQVEFVLFGTPNFPISSGERPPHPPAYALLRFSCYLNVLGEFDEMDVKYQLRGDDGKSLLNPLLGKKWNLQTVSSTGGSGWQFYSVSKTRYILRSILDEDEGAAKDEVYATISVENEGQVLLKNDTKVLKKHFEMPAS